MGPLTTRDIFICGVQFDDPLKSGAISQLQLATTAARLRVQGVEYREVYWKEKAKEIPEARDKTAELGLKLSYATFTTLFNRDAAKREQLLADLEDARALGSPRMRVFPGPTPDNSLEGKAMLDGARRAIDKAGEFGMRLALENFSGNPGGTLADIQANLALVDSEVVGVNVDTANYFGHGQDVLEAIKALSPRIIYCHLKDAASTPSGHRATYLGDGVLPIAEILAALEATGNQFPITLEFGPDGADGEGAITKSLAYLGRAK